MALPPEQLESDRERRRLEALLDYDVLDTPPERVFDDIVSVAAHICDVPMALISLVDDKRQWFKSALGLTVRETPRGIAFCAHAIEQTAGIFQVADTQRDTRFQDNPLVRGDPNLRFYAGAPLRTPDGYAIGTLCVLDTKPGALTASQQLALEALARQVIMQLELRRELVLRRAAETRSRHSEDLLRRAQEAGGVGVFAVDVLTGAVTGSPQFWRFYGLQPSDGAQRAKVAELVVTDDLPTVAPTGTDDVRSTPPAVEYRVRRADTGKIRWLSRRGEFELDERGEPVRLVGVVRDVTERKRAQQAAAQSAAQFLALAQSQPNQVWTASSAGIIEWLNDQAYAYSGRERGSLEGEQWSQYVHPDDLPAAAERWAVVLENGADYEAEFRLRRADGEYRWHMARAVPMRAADGSIERWIGTNTDIHERKTAELTSHRDRERIWTLSQELMMVCDHNTLITAVNPSATRILGYREDELVGRRVTDFVHPEDLSPTRAEVLKLTQNVPCLSFENRWRASDGSFRLIEWTAVPENERIHGVGRDVTQERITAEALRQAQKMEAVGQLTGGIAHDFNNLLQGITGSLELVKKRLLQGRPEELDRFIDGAMTSANRAAALTHRLLAFSRRQPLAPVAILANPLLASMEDLLRRTLGERLQLDLLLSDELWLTKVDPNQLESAILNLVINARDAMPGSGTVTIETSNTRIDMHYAHHNPETRPGQYVCISVSDTGTGMSADTLSKVFEPFFTTKPLGQGTGLGLSMIYGFAKQSEGSVKIDSELGSGTSVKLHLPRFYGELAAEEEAQEAAAARAIQHETVLVVEDEPVVRSLIVTVLTDLGYRSLEAADGPAGLRCVQSKDRIDLVISDVGLPGLNGRQLAEAARLTRPNLKFLFMTGYAENAVMASGFLEPGMSMITKPFAIDALAARIRETLQPG